MRWRFWQRPHPPIHIDPKVGREAAAARKAADAQWQRVRKVVDSHRQLRRENHFAEMLQHAMEGKRR